MKRLKTLFAFILIFTLCIAYAPAVLADTTVTTTDKAEALDILSLLSGDGHGDYLLNKPLLRSEAAIFIVRLLGKTTYVLDNKATLSVTGFTDVDSNQLYAPYVGYCTSQGIIAGIGNGKYDPNASISEKAFLKLLIMTLGYDYATDFTYSDVYSKAYQLGLVTDSSYLTKTADNNNYLRANVVEAMYNALTKVNKKTNTTLLQGLLNGGAITRDQVVSAGFDTGTVVAVAQTIVLNEKSIYIVFDRNVQTIAPENIKIHETSDPTKLLDVTIQAQQPNSIVINTSQQTAYLNYTVEISNVTAAGGVLSSAVTTTFDGYRAAELTSDFFRISKVEPVSQTVLNVYFTHPVNINAEKGAYYTIMDGDTLVAQGFNNTLTAKYAGTPNNMVVLGLQGVALTAGKQYILKIAGDLESVYGASLGDGQGDSLKFAVSSSTTATTNPGTGATSGMTVTQISVLDYRTVQLTFNMEVHPTRAQQIYSYYITDSYGNPLQVSKAALVGGGKVVYLSINGSFVKTNGYKIMINEIDDITKQYSIIEKEYTFSGTYTDRTPLNIQSVTAIDKNTVTVSFDRPLDPDAALTSQYYSITGISQTTYSAMPSKVMFDSDSDTSKVDLYLPAGKELASGYSYKLTVLSVMKDNLGNVAGTNREATFNGNSSTSAKPYISDAVIISKDTIKITTSRKISLSLPDILASNYSLTYTDGISVVKVVPKYVGIVDNSTLFLVFDTLDFNKVYTLSFDSLEDYSEMYTRTAADGQNTITVRVGK